MPSPSAKFRLADHVRACRVDGQVVLLDLRRNKYLGIGGQPLASLSSAIVDWPKCADTSPPPVDEAGLKAWLKPLIDQCMLTSDSKAPQPRATIDAAADSLCPDSQPGMAGEWCQLMKLCWASLVAAHWLRRHALAEIADRVLRLRPRDGQHCGTDGQKLQAAVSSYMHLRPFVLSTHDECLHDSLSLIRFLAMDAMYPTWVVGVRTRPFGAHSWVQSGGLVLNDVPENVRAYKPILVV
jgi:hypothetical protein